MLAVLAVLLGACSADPDSTGSSRTGESGSAASKDPAGPEPTFDPDEPTLPGGVRVLSQATTDDMVALDAGRYGVRVSDSLLYTVDVPTASEVAAGTYLNPGSRDTGRNGILWIDEVGNDTAVPVDPCRDHDPIPVGPTVADLATALIKQPSWSEKGFLTVTKPTQVTVGGMKGLFVKATVPKDADMSACQDNSVDLISENHSAGPGIVQRMWILDVDGTRHVIHAKVGAHDANANQHTKAMNRMVESITFNPG